MPIFLNGGKIATLFMINHISTRFGVPQVIVTDHGTLFLNHMMVELSTKLGFHHENASPYYPKLMERLRPLTRS
jgi:hypothetical protein